MKINDNAIYCSLWSDNKDCLNDVNTVQWNLRIKDTLGAELLSSGGRFIQITIL